MIYRNQGMSCPSPWNTWQDFQRCIMSCLERWMHLPTVSSFQKSLPIVGEQRLNWTNWNWVISEELPQINYYLQWSCFRPLEFFAVRPKIIVKLVLGHFRPINNHSPEIQLKEALNRSDPFFSGFQLAVFSRFSLLRLPCRVILFSLWVAQYMSP